MAMIKSLRKMRRRAVSLSMARLTTPKTEPSPTIDTREHAKQGGILRDDITELNLPASLSNIEDKAMAVDPTKIVLVIVVFALIFIALITWFIANEPPRQ